MKTRSHIYLTVIALVCCFSSTAIAKKSPVITWLKQFQPGGIYISDIHQTSDGGFILAGSAPVDTPATGFDYWVAKTNDTGMVQWEHTYYRTAGYNYYYDRVTSIHQTRDEGYILCGYYSEYSNSSSAFRWIVKLDARGSIQWERLSDSIYGEIIRQTGDGGYVMVGGGVLKLDSAGNT